MSLRNIHPLHVMWQAGLEEEMLDGVFSAIAYILWLADVSQLLPVERLGQRRQPNWRNKKGIIRRYKSLDWHIKWARENSKKAGYLNSVLLLDSLQDNPTFKTKPRYELVVVKDPIYYNDTSLENIDGIGGKGRGAIITIGKYLHLLQPLPGESEKEKRGRESRFFLSTYMLTLHELAHVLGLCPRVKNDSADEEQNKGHCLNKCVMRRQEDSELEREIRDDPFCSECKEKIPLFFVAP